MQKRYGKHCVPDRQKKQMMRKYILSVDQSTQGTKGMLFDENGILVARADKAHRQIVNALGWVSHDLSEILDNTLAVCHEVVQKAGIDKNEILAMAISNQRETTAAWDKETGKPLCDAIVWQCSRASKICASMTQQDKELVFSRTGLMLSPYFPAAKMAWILRNVLTGEAVGSETKGPECKEHLAFGTIDSWLIYSLCEGHPHKCDYSNASCSISETFVGIRICARCSEFRQTVCRRSACRTAASVIRIWEVFWIIPSRFTECWGTAMEHCSGMEAKGSAE